MTTSGIGFQPNFTWLKENSANTQHHQLYDSARGAGKVVYSNLNNAETNDLSHKMLSNLVNLLVIIYSKYYSCKIT